MQQTSERGVSPRAEPQADRGHGHRAMKDIGPLVVTGCARPEGLESVDRPFDFVAPAIDHTVETGRSSTSVAAASAVGSLVPGMVCLIWRRCKYRRLHRPERLAGFAPTCRLPTTCDGGHAPFSSSRTGLADPATADPSAAGTGSR